MIFEPDLSLAAQIITLCFISKVKVKENGKFVVGDLSPISSGATRNADEYAQIAAIA